MNKSLVGKRHYLQSRVSIVAIEMGLADTPRTLSQYSAPIASVNSPQSLRFLPRINQTTFFRFLAAKNL